MKAILAALLFLLTSSFALTGQTVFVYVTPNPPHVTGQFIPVTDVVGPPLYFTEPGYFCVRLPQANGAHTVAAVTPVFVVRRAP